jgi:hypothetical protein
LHSIYLALFFFPHSDQNSCYKLGKITWARSGFVFVICEPEIPQRAATTEVKSESWIRSNFRCNCPAKAVVHIRHSCRERLFQVKGTNASLMGERISDQDLGLVNSQPHSLIFLSGGKAWHAGEPFSLRRQWQQAEEVMLSSLFTHSLLQCFSDERILKPRRLACVWEPGTSHASEMLNKSLLAPCFCTPPLPTSALWTVSL